MKVVQLILRENVKLSLFLKLQIFHTVFLEILCDWLE